MFQGLTLGRIAGIAIVLDWSLLIIFALITVSLATGVFPLWHPDWSTGLVWTTALAAAALFFASVLIHELSHALVGRLTGVKVRRITLFMFGGIAHMDNEAASWRAELAIALVGPVTSLVLGVLFLILGGAAAGPLELDPENPAATLAALNPAATLLSWLGPVNIVLAIFNLVPGFPLDGGRALRAVLWGVTGDLRRATQWASRAGQAFAWLLMACGILMIIGVRVPFFGTGLVGGLWLIFIGWFLNNAAVLGYQQLILNEALRDVPVSRLMLTAVKRVDARMRVRELAEEHVIASGQRLFAVEDAGRLVGVVSLRDLQALPRDAWNDATLERIMTPRARLITVSPRDSASDAMAQLAKNDVNQLPVLEGERLVGLLRREDVLKWLWLAGGEVPGHGGPTRALAGPAR